MGSPTRSQVPAALWLRARWSLLSASLALLAAVALTWPMVTDLTQLQVDGFFQDSQVWCFAYMADMIWDGAGWESSRLGWPHTATLRFIGWAPAWLASWFQGGLGPLGAYNVALLSSLPLAALLGTLLLQAGGASGAGAAAGGLLYALCPLTLGCLAAGQIEKVQHWTFAAALLAVWLGTRRALLAPLAPLAALLVAVTSPSFAMILPLGATIWALWAALSLPTWARRAGGLVRAAGVLALVAAALIWIRPHYDLAPQKGMLYAFAPSTAPSVQSAKRLQGVARLEALRWGPAAPYQDPGASQSVQVAYLGAPALASAGLMALWATPGARLGGAAALLGGTVLALGPRLADADGYVTTADGLELTLPAVLLERIDYPIARSGMYYRFLLLASLGTAVLVAGGARGFWRSVLAWVLVAGVLADTWRVTAPLWPRPSAPIEGRAALLAMRTDPGRGAVLATPLRVDDRDAGRQLLLATVHGRPTNALPRDMQRQPPTETALGWLAEPAPAEALRAAGVRFVVWDTRLRSRGAEPSLADWTALLGAPQADGALRWWRLEDPE